MKKTLSLLLSAVMLMTSVLALPVLSYANGREPIEEGIAFEVTMRYELVDWEDESFAISAYSFTPADTDYYYVELENNVFECRITDSEAKAVELTYGYYKLEAGQTYNVDFELLGSPEIDKQYEDAYSSPDFDGNLTIEATAIGTVYKVNDSYTDEYLYTIDKNNKVKITAYIGTEKDVVIPSTILGMPVTYISTESMTKAENVVVPQSVETVQFGAFSGNVLKSITFENPSTDIQVEFDSNYKELFELYGLNAPVNGQPWYSFNEIIEILSQVLSPEIANKIAEDILIAPGDDFDRDEKVVICTIPFDATIYAAHDSTAAAYAYDWGNAFYGTDGHTISSKEIPATCVAEGSKNYTCDKCDYAESEVIAPLGHTVVADEAVAPTCTEAGKTEGSHCSVCGEVITAQDDIAALGHDYQEAVTAPTCTAGGFTTYTCSRCGDTYTANETEATGHVWDDGEITKAPTCTVAGEKTYTCTVCGETKKEEVAAKGHTVVVDKAVAATFKAAGKTEGKHCSVCNTVITAQKSVAKLVSPTVSKLTAGKKSFTATWKKAPTVDGYQIQYATSAKFSKAKSVTVKKDSTTKTTVKKLTAKKKYFVRVRAYKTINGKKVYSAWSKAKTVTTKK